MPDNSKQSALILIVIALLTLGVMGGGVGLVFFGNRDRAEVGPEPAPERVEPPTDAGSVTVGLVAPLEKPAPPKMGFVGSQKCAGCHQEVADQYATHSMSRSLASIQTATPIEVYVAEDVAPPGPRRYRVENREGKIFHHELMLDSQGNPIYDQEVEVKYVLGSGKRGRAYLTFEQGKFFQSSIGWYSSNKKWDLSPGYKPDRHSRFARRLGDGCFYCHAGRTSLNSVDEHYIEPPFPEEAIGCERCHGPGKEHVAVREEGRWTEGMVDPIVNPRRLEPSQREDVCNQCHLQGDAIILRYGKGHMDFRPGQRLEDNWAIFVSGDRVEDSGETKAVSQVQQMRASACFQASDGSFGCISCHNAHFEPAPPDRVSFYRARCLECHAQKGCSLAELDRLAQSPEDSCIQCHMPRLSAHDVPHTAQTDHRVRRRPGETTASAAEDAKPRDFQIFDGAEQRLPVREVNRARALALLEQPMVMSDPELLTMTQVMLSPPLRQMADRYDDSFLDYMGDDIPGLFGLGRTFQMMGDVPRAEACWDTILRIEPNNEAALFWKSLNAQRAREFPRASQLLDRLMSLNPLDAHLHGQKAILLGQMGQWPSACASAERSLQLDPSVLAMREFLAEAYGNAHQVELQKQQLEIIQRMKEVGAIGSASPPATGSTSADGR